MAMRLPDAVVAYYRRLDDSDFAGAAAAFAADIVYARHRSADHRTPSGLSCEVARSSYDRSRTGAGNRSATGSWRGPVRDGGSCSKAPARTGPGRSKGVLPVRHRQRRRRVEDRVGLLSRQNVRHDGRLLLQAKHITMDLLVDARDGWGAAMRNAGADR